MSDSNSLTEYILKRYLQENENSWEDICRRVSTNVYPYIYPDMISKKFIPAGRTLATVGTRFNIIPNCVTIDLEDDLAGIFETTRRLMELTRRGSGIGMNFSKLRPAMTEARHFAASSSGPTSFLNMISVTMRTVQQQKRHGAFIGILSIEHPDVLSFIRVKQDLKKINNFNLSILLTKDFLDHLRDTPDEPAKAFFEVVHNDGSKEIIDYYQEVNYDDNLIALGTKRIDITYKELMNELTYCAWNTGEPGVLFEDNMNVGNELIKYLGPMNCANPCAEITMYQNECCNLGSINLDQFTTEVFHDTLKDIEDGKKTVEDIIDLYINTDDLKQVVKRAVIFLDAMIDLIRTDDEIIDKFLSTTRRLGLGVMGLHDMLIKLKIPYDSKHARKLVEEIIKLIRDTAYDTSKDLVMMQGTVIERLVKNGYIKKYEDDCPLLSTIANIALMTIAPNGSTAMIPNVSAGVEPYFSLGYYRVIDNGTSKTDLIVNPKLKEYLEHTCTSQEEIDKQLHKIISEGISLSDLPEFIKKVFKTAKDISPEDHIRMEAAAQKYIDNSISKTVNLPADATIDDVKNAYLLAHELGVKGSTVFRDSCRDGILITLSKDSCKDGKCDI